MRPVLSLCRSTPSAVRLQSSFVRRHGWSRCCSAALSTTPAHGAAPASDGADAAEQAAATRVQAQQRGRMARRLAAEDSGRDSSELEKLVTPFT
eukprot:COSAG04_NODE_7763_length_1069_cov_1.130658_1_plen_94_part_00